MEKTPIIIELTVNDADKVDTFWNLIHFNIPSLSLDQTYEPIRMTDNSVIIRGKIDPRYQSELLQHVGVIAIFDDGPLFATD